MEVFIMDELMKFEGNNVEIIQDANGNPLFEVYSTGMALGYTCTAKGKIYPYKERINKIVENAEITLVSHSVKRYLNESQLYDFMLEARTDKCRKFRKWITNDVLPTIRKTGAYSVATAPQLPYVYIEKTYHARPVMTVNDISNIFGVNSVTLYNFIKARLLPNRDYDLLQNETLVEYTKENSDLPRCRKSIFVIYNTGLSRIISYFNLDGSKTPKFMTEHGGYVVQAEVRKVMEYVRREIKGIEALTYLVESDETPRNLEIYRKNLVKKLSAIQWWKLDVSTIKLGIHHTSGTELKAIHNGEYGINY